MVVPAADAAAIHAAIPGAKEDNQGGFTVPCTTKAIVALTFGGQSFAIDPRDIAFIPVDAADPTGDCVSGIAAGNIGGANEWLVSPNLSCTGHLFHVPSMQPGRRRFLEERVFLNRRRH